MRVPMPFTWVALLCLGCELYQVPDSGPGEEAVFEAATRAILARYPTARPVEKSNLVMALTPVEMDGAYKSRRQITVHVKQNYTGAWEPAVRIVMHVEMAEPILGTDPEAEDPVAANPVATHKWQPLQHLPAEENALLEEIKKQLPTI